MDASKAPPAGREYWYERSFGPYYLDLYGHRDASEAEAAVRILAARLPAAREARPGAPAILDIACGAGRHLGPLLRAGFQAFGLDLSRHMLGRANRSAPGRVVRGDMRRLPFGDGAFGAAISMFTSIGYFPDSSEDRAVLAEAGRVVAGGGGFALDYLNSVTTRAGLMPRTRRVMGSYEVLEERRLVAGADGRERVLKTVEIRQGDTILERLSEEVLLLDHRELESLLEEAGFEVIERLGDYRGNPFVADASPRCFLISRRVP
jgi:SAM-dependent methyltransferase